MDDDNDDDDDDDGMRPDPPTATKPRARLRGVGLLFLKFLKNHLCRRSINLLEVLF